MAYLKFDVDKVDIDKLKNVPINLSNLKSNLDKFVPAPVGLSKLSDVVKMMLVKKMRIIVILKTSKIKFLILLT